MQFLEEKNSKLNANNIFTKNISKFTKSKKLFKKPISL